jgi:superfamily I DNA/RNA helicase
MTSRSLGPRDFAIIVRQRADEYTAELAPAFAERGIPIRNEARRIGTVALQDLLPEDICQHLVQLLRIATSDRAGKRWSECLRATASLRGITDDDDAGQGRLSRQLQEFCQKFLKAHPNPPESEADAKAIVDELLGFVGRERLIAAHASYRQGTRFAGLVAAAVTHLTESSDSASDWAGALDEFEGLNALPLMTIHKSKGLEYHTIMFVGLDDSAWWSYDEDAVEATAGFFVAFTRAKQRVVFTYCQARGNRVMINALYDLLRQAGIESTSP